MAKLTSEIAKKFVDRIEALQEQIDAVYAEANAYDGLANSNVIRDAVKARVARKEAEYDESALFSSLDVEDE